MALAKQVLNINFAQGLDTKTDPWQVAPGRFLELVNSVFTKQGLLQKRNGFGPLAALPDSSSTTLTTFSDNLLSVGTNLRLYSEDSNTWISKGMIQPLSLGVTPLVRTSTSQVSADTAISSNGLACTTYVDTSIAYYIICDSATGQTIVPITALPSTAARPRVFALGRYFIITFAATVGGSPHLRYIAIPINNPTNPGAATDISTQISGLTGAYDGIIANNNLYLAFNGSDGGGAVRLVYLDSTLVVHSAVAFATETATIMSIAADTSSPTTVIYASYYNGTNVRTLAVNQQLTTLLAPKNTITGLTIVELTSAANAGSTIIFAEVSNTYGYSSVRTDYLVKATCTQSGTVVGPTIVIRSLGLASKAFRIAATGSYYVLGAYAGAAQPTYFLVDSSGNVVAKLAYSNGAGYAQNHILPQANVSGTEVSIAYLIKDLLVPVNKTQGAPASAAVYTQTGINLASFTFNTTNLTCLSIGNNLHLTGGFLWMYAGAVPVEHGFHLWPDDIDVSTNGAGGSISAQTYFYACTYEWTDEQGNLHRSAPSVPTTIVTTGATSTNTIKIPTLRLTYKVSPNPVRIVIYRWSEGQQTYYQITSISSPLLNDPTADSVTYSDTAADSAIVGNPILYTTGGVVENIGAPACNTATLYKSRFLLLDAEDENLVWFSKQVIESTPVEMSDLLTLFIAPTIGAQGSTGKNRVISSMDDKIIAFKKDAIYYLTGTGPDNTGANNDFSDPVLITATVGSDNPQSVVFTPQGLMFQSDKGIWLLGRDLNTTYIGARVEAFNSFRVVSAVTVPGTNQVRFMLDNGLSLMYDYFFNEWSSFLGIPGISSTIYNSLHTYLNDSGQVFQETPGSYLDGSKPVLMSFKTSWFNLAGVQGFERAYWFHLLGQYMSPHKLAVSIAYDYNPTATQLSIITPDNYAPLYGGDTLYGASNYYGGPPQTEEWQVFLERQKCSAFQISLQEVYDLSFNQPAGAGLTLSSLNLTYGIKKGYKPKAAANQVG